MSVSAESSAGPEETPSEMAEPSRAAVAAAHFVVSSAIILSAWRRSRSLCDPGAWYVAPLVLAPMLVPLAYQGVLLG